MWACRRRALCFRWTNHPHQSHSIMQQQEENVNEMWKSSVMWHSWSRVSWQLCGVWKSAEICYGSRVDMSHSKVVVLRCVDGFSNARNQAEVRQFSSFHNLVRGSCIIWLDSTLNGFPGGFWILFPLTNYLTNFFNACCNLVNVHWNWTSIWDIRNLLILKIVDDHDGGRCLMLWPLRSRATKGLVRLWEPQSSH